MLSVGLYLTFERGARIGNGISTPHPTVGGERQKGGFGFRLCVIRTVRAPVGEPF